MKPYYEDAASRIKLFHGDCLEVLAALPPCLTFDLCFTSPPYNLARTADGRPLRGGDYAKLSSGYADHADDMPWEEYREWQHRVLLEVWKHISERGAIYYNHKPRPESHAYRLPLDYNPGLPLRQIVTWDRLGQINYSTAFYAPRTEWILVFAREEWSLADRSASAVSDLWAASPPMDSWHPAPFPIELPLKAIATTKPACVLDPFAGSGTTLLAAKRLGVPAMGIELSEAYCERIADALRQAVLFGVSGGVA